MANALIKSLKDIGMPDAVRFGSKAAMLGEMIKWGFDVPDGYALPVECFHSFLNNNNFPYATGEYAAYSAEIRECLGNYGFSQEFHNSLNRCVEGLLNEYPDDEIIVRTSALCEDSEASAMAGVFSSFSGLKTIEEVQEAVKACYISLFSDKVLNDHVAGIINGDTLKAGIIIQRYVRGDISGVTFTADAIEMDPGVIKISSTKGLCSSLTDGSGCAVTYSCDKNSLEVKTIHGNEMPLTDEKLHQLLESAKKIEKLAGYYQDIEWTFFENRLYILQTRPITNFRDALFSIDWKVDNEKYKNNAWILADDRCYLPLIGELVMESNNCAGSCAYEFGMEWDSEICMMMNGYLYKSRREIPNSQARLDVYMGKINGQFDNGEDEFDKYIKPELSSLIDHMHSEYIDKNLSDHVLHCYLNEAHFYMKRSTALHWRATTSEWYMGYFFRQRVERFFDKISQQDLVDLAYSKSMMTVEREEIYRMVKYVQENIGLKELFDKYKYDSIIAARLVRMKTQAALHLLELIKEYGNKYGWYYSRSFEEGLNDVGVIPVKDCINRIKRYLHIDLDDYSMNINNIKENAKRLKELGYGKCQTQADINAFETAVKAGVKAFLAGDNHAYYICSRKFVYLSDALLKTADAFAKNNVLDVPRDIHFLYMNEIKDLLIHGGSAKETVSMRKAIHETQKRMLPPRNIGAITSNETKNDSPQAENNATHKIKGESGSKKNIQGRIHIGFPEQPTEYDMILLLDHGHEGDLTAILEHVKGIILKMGTPACHMGILARELNIPAIYGVGSQANILKTGDRVEIRGEAGEVVLIGDQVILSAHEGLF